MSHRPEPRVRFIERVSAPLSPSARLRCDVVFRLLAELPEVRSIMEVGCGQGGLATLLAQTYDYRGYEPDRQSFAIARERLSRRRSGAVVNSLFPQHPDRTFDVVAAFEVLEHQEDDRSALASWVQWVRPGGHLLLSVPAHPSRFGAADRYVGHFRRYSRAGLGDLLYDAGLDERRILTYGFPLGYALESVRNVIISAREKREIGAREERTAASGRRFQPGERLAPLISTAVLPFQYMQRPFAGTQLGTGFVARARRPAETDTDDCRAHRRRMTGDT
jgi:SAM-dependent methyltransferase